MGKEHIFLHGELDLWILEAKSLPNMDLASERVRRCFTLFGSFQHPPFSMMNRTRRRPKDQVRPAGPGKPAIITSDPYVSVCLAGATVAQTRVIANCENPLWDEHFRVPVAHPVEQVEFHVKDNDVLGAQHIGVVAISVDNIISGNKINDWFPIIGHHGNCLKPYPELHLTIQFKPVRDNPLYKDGVGAGPDYLGVPNTYFPLRKGGSVTLYQDAHVPDGMLPEIPLTSNHNFEQGKCWEDMCHAILEAHHLIYLVGWSVYRRVKLVWEPTKPLPAAGQLSLGELLKYKSQEGVRVVLLIWDDKTSHDKFLLKTEGVMQTHDEDTKKFFRHSSVHCVLCPRYASNKLSIFKQQVVGTLFTHHQKCVVLDTGAAGNNRKMTAFIGGLDLCDGRYDTPEHRLFRDLDTVFENDYHNPTFPNLTGAKNLIVDKSIHTAYVKAIRSAQHFIYIENQYFVGSSYFWPSYKNAGADNVIPVELALKIASKIKENEPFRVYIVIPMWPEGVPTSASVQEILFWQGQTMAMMYHVVAEAIKKEGLSDEYHPQDYLNFFCLGKREASSSHQTCSFSSHTNLQPTENRALASVQKLRRFMIYVHSKGMIVDDEYIIMGSANINQRSLDGSRDTEIAMSAYQPKHTWAANNSHPHGKVYGYRMSLWAEHLGKLEDTFREPHSLECAKRVNKIAKQNWKAYVAEEENNKLEITMLGHLMQYPVEIGRDGKVSPMKGYEQFPDVGGKVLGTPTTLPDALTT